jgi:phage shock protein E
MQVMSRSGIAVVLAVVALLLGHTKSAADVVWIDVRSDEEHRDNHIAGDTHIPFRQIAEQIGAHVSDKDAEIALYCASGGRSWIAKRTLDELGYTRVSNAGGIDQVRKQRGLDR